MPGVSGFANSLTALTKQRRPSLVRTRAATPGENPPACAIASTTVPPMRSSIARFTADGSCPQWTRTPSAGRALDEATAPQHQVAVDAFLHRVAHLVRDRHD